MFTFVCEKCGGTFQSKSDPSKWRHRLCNNCRGNQYASNPQGNAYTPRPVPVQPQPVSQGVVYNSQSTPIKKEFDVETYVADMLLVYATLKRMVDENKMTIPESSLCQWVTSIMIQKEKIK